MIRKTLVLFVGILVLLWSRSAFALTWDYTGDIAGTVETGLVVGASSVNAAEGDSQILGKSGAGTLLPAGVSQYNVDFHLNASTWDSYSAADLYWDVFAATMSTSAYYWNLPDTTIHPLENNPDVILADSSSIGQSYWGGQSWQDGVLESLDKDINLHFTVDPLKQHYLSVFLQTDCQANDQFPSWGTVSDMKVTPVPEPISSTLFLLGAGALGLKTYRRKKKA